MKKSPNIPMSHSLKNLIFAYVSAICIALLLLIAGQSLIQWTLAQEVHERSVIAQVNAQELRTQEMFYKVILLQNPEGNGINYLQIAQEVQGNEAQWETMQEAMYQGNPALGISPSDFSDGAETTIAQEKKGFLTMEAAYRHIFLLEAHYHPANPDLVRKDVDTIYLQEADYLQSLITTYGDLVTQADQRVSEVRWIEFVLAILTGLVLNYEAFFVVRPAIKQLQNALHVLGEALEKPNAKS